MSTFRIGKPRRPSLPRVLGFAAAAAATLVTGCKNSNDITGPSSSAMAYLGGAWVGTFTPAEPALYAESVPAQATLQQTGSSVDGTIQISGSSTVMVHATVSGIRVSGTIEDASGAGTAVGGLVAARLTLTLHPRAASGAGELQLHR